MKNAHTYKHIGAHSTGHKYDNPDTCTHIRTHTNEDMHTHTHINTLTQRKAHRQANEFQFAYTDKIS